MHKKKILIAALALAGILMLIVAVGAAAGLRSSPAETLTVSTIGGGEASLLHFNLAEMTRRADKIFRGTVVDFSPASVEAGGGVLPIVIYQIRVDEAFKGEFASKGDVQYIELRMLGSVKDASLRAELKQFSAVPEPPQLSVGHDYLLFTTPESAIGLSTAVGLGQGSFEIFSLDKQEWVKNDFDNAGLYDGAVPYSQLAGDIEALVAE
jgi:hypothetical protein